MIAATTTAAQPLTHSARYARNRRLLIGALAAGMQVRRMWGDRFAVTSRSAAQPRQVTRWRDADAVLHFGCSCRWPEFHGDFRVRDWPGPAHIHEGLPCSHVLLLRFWLLPNEARMAALGADAELAAAWARNIKGLA